MDSGLEQSGTSTPRRGKRLTCTDGFNNLMVSLRGTFDKLNQLWDEVEMEDWQRRQRMETAFKHTDDLLQEMIEAETTMVVSVKENIEHGLKEIDKLREQLEHEAWIRPRYAPNSLLMLKAIKSEVTSLKQEYEVRLEDQLATIKRMEELCFRLGELAASVALEDGDLLAADEFSMLSSQCEEMESQLMERIANLRKAQTITKKALKTLGKKQSETSDVLKQLLKLDLDDESLVLSKEIVGSYDEAVKALQFELNEYVSTLDFKYTEKWITLKDLWEKCSLLPNELSYPERFSADLHDNRTFEAMDQEIARLTADYERRKEVLCKILEWKKLWEEKLAHEEFEHDPNRFNNRGGELEKRLNRDRLVNQKLLPAMEQEIAKAMARYKEMYPEGFLIEGVDPVEWIGWRKMNHMENKGFDAQQARMLKQLTPGPRRPLLPAVSPAIPDLSVIGPPRPVGPGPKTSSPKATKRAPPLCASVCPSPIKRTKTPLGRKNWLP